MIKSILTYTALVIGATLSGQSFEKTVMASGGGNQLNGTGISVDFTVGEPVVGMAKNKKTIDQGFWASGNLIVTPLDSGEEKNFGILVFPNPVDSELTIFANNQNIIGINLYSVNGQRAMEQLIDASELEYKIDFSYISKGVYVLQLYLEGQSKPKLFKIIKN